MDVWTADPENPAVVVKRSRKPIEGSSLATAKVKSVNSSKYTPKMPSSLLEVSREDVKDAAVPEEERTRVHLPLELQHN
jgi:hypothetical protein